MTNSTKCFTIGGWQLRYNESCDNVIGWEFSKRFDEFSSDYSESTDISLKNQKNRSLIPNMITSEAATVYEQKNGIFTYNIYRCKSNEHLWVTWIKHRYVFMAYSVDLMWRNVCLLADYTESDGLEAFDHFADIFSYSVLALGGIIFHGVVMEYQGRGVILSAPSGTGKTTHSNIWRDLGLSTIINGDRALCRYVNDTWTVFGMPWCGTSGISENRQVPILTIVVLEQHSENIVKRLAPLEALTRLLSNTYAPSWEPTLYSKMLDRLDEIITVVPIFLLRCRPDEDAALLLKSALDTLL